MEQAELEAAIAMSLAMEEERLRLLKLEAKHEGIDQEGQEAQNVTHHVIDEASSDCYSHHNTVNNSQGGGVSEEKNSQPGKGPTITSKGVDLLKVSD